MTEKKKLYWWVVWDIYCGMTWLLVAPTRGKAKSKIWSEYGGFVPDVPSGVYAEHYTDYRVKRASIADVTIWQSDFLENLVIPEDDESWRILAPPIETG